MKSRLAVVIALSAASATAHAAAVDDEPGCSGLTAQQCVARALDAMGGKSKLAAITAIGLDVISHTIAPEQSYRQAPFITAYDRDHRVIDLAGRRFRDDDHNVWPESDAHEAESDHALIVTAAACASQQGSDFSPCGASTGAQAREVFALGPLRLLLTAVAAHDLRYEPAQTIRGSAHAVISFGYGDRRVRVLLNGYNHLPDAIATTRQFDDFWYFFGDVAQVVYWDNWRLVGGVVYPSTEVVERNGLQWRSSQVLDIELHPKLEATAFAIPAAVATASAKQAGGWDAPFSADNRIALAPGVTLYAGSWNTTIINQDDGTLILESPISPTYTRGILAEARTRAPGVPIKAVLSTSDSWPHVGGVRQAVAEHVPVYTLDLNIPLLDRMIAAPHTLAPDALQQAPVPASWQVVTGKTVIGRGANRVELYPMRGGLTERQYLVYFPGHKLLYASDTLVVDPDKHALYYPELLHEVAQTVEREHLAVDTVYAMHQLPMKWADALALLRRVG